MHVVGEVVNVLTDESVLGSQGRVDMDIFGLSQRYE